MSCKNKVETTKKEAILMENNTSFFVGTYTDTKSEGIYTYALSDSGKIKKIGLAAKTKNPGAWGNRGLAEKLPRSPQWLPGLTESR